MFHNISNPKWFGNWSRLEDDYLGNGGTDIADNFTFSKMEKTGGLFGSIIRLATAFPACDPETGHATGAWKVACESIDLDEVPLSDIADMISGFDCETITDFRLFNTGAFDDTPWQQALGELLLHLQPSSRCTRSEGVLSIERACQTSARPYLGTDKAPARAFRASGRAHGFRPGRYDGCRPCRCGRGRASPHRSVETGRERRKRRTMRSRHHRLQRLRETGKLFSSQDAADAAASPLSGHRKRPGTRCASQTSIVWGQHRKSRP